MEDKATEIAKKYGGNTLEGTLKDNNVKVPGWIKDPKDPRRQLVQEKMELRLRDLRQELPGRQGVRGLPRSPWEGPRHLPCRREDNVFKVTEHPRLVQDGKGTSPRSIPGPATSARTA